MEDYQSHAAGGVRLYVEAGGMCKSMNFLKKQRTYYKMSL